jgi:hypothetical protein
MPLRWRIDDDTRRVEVVAEETITSVEIRDYLERVAQAGAMAYAKLFDASAAKVEVSVDELKAIAAWVRKFAIDGRGPIGPLAIVVSSQSHFDAARFADAAGSIRPLQIFRDEGEAQAWLKHVTSSGARR